VKKGNASEAVVSSGSTNDLPALISAVVAAILGVGLAWHVYRRCSERRPKLSSVVPELHHEAEGSPQSKDERSTAEGTAKNSLDANGDDTVSETSFHEEEPPRVSSRDHEDFLDDDTDQFVQPPNPHAEYDPSVWPILEQIDAELNNVTTNGDSAAVRKTIRRLYLMWHPDKNLDSVARATEVFRYIQEKVSPDARQLDDDG
jgi:hypothetical protein